MNFNFSERDFLISLVLFSATVLFLLYLFVFSSAKVKNYFYSQSGAVEGNIRHILFTKYTGFFLMGLVPAILLVVFFPDYNLSELGLGFSSETWMTSLFWILACGALIVPMSYKISSQKHILEAYPQIRVKVWDNNLLRRYISGWCFYLLGYEFLFRVFLLIPLCDLLGVWPAIFINIGFYSLAHIPNGLDQALGTIPIGFLLCWITLQTGNIWAAYIIHIFLALSNSLFALKFNPEMHFIKNRKKE